MAKKIIIDLEVKSKKGVKEVEKLNKELKTTSQELSGATNTLDKFTGGAVSKVKGFGGAIKGLTTGFKSLRVAIIATGIGALLIAVTALGQAFTRSEEGQNKFSKILGVIGSVTSNLLDVFADLGSAIISVFENPKKAIQDFTKLIKENIINRFEGMLQLIPKLGEAVNQLFKGNFSEAGKIAADAVGKVTLGVESITTSISNATKAVVTFGKEINEEAKLSQKIADDRAKADKIDRKNTVDRAKANQRISELRFKAEQRDKFSAEERVEFLKEASKLEEETTNKEIEAARLRFEAKKLENSLSKSTKEDKDEEARLEAQLIQLTTSKLNLQKRLQTSITTFQNEVKTQKEAEIKAEEDEQKKIKEKQDKKIEEEAQAEAKRLDSIDKIQKDYKDRKAEEDAQSEVEKIELEQSRALAELDRLNATEEQKSAIRIFYSDKIKKAEKKDKDESNRIEKEKKDYKEQQYRKGYEDLQNIVSIGGKKLEKVGKALAIADVVRSSVKSISETVSSTGIANAKAVAASPLTGGMPFVGINTVKAALSIGSTIASATKSIQSIKGNAKTVSPQSIPSNGGGGGASVPPAFNVVGASGTNQLADAIGGQSQKPVQAYVVGNDVTTSQSMDRAIIDDASLGG
jgi:hypothetical protein